MRDRFSSSMITVAIAAAAVSASSRCRSHGRRVRPCGQPASAASPTSAASGKPITKPTGICRGTRRCPPPSRSWACILMTTRGCRQLRFSRSRRGRRTRIARVVQGDGQIPYKPEALLIKKENAEHWIDRDPD